MGLKNKGPIPVGNWKITASNANKGPLTFVLSEKSVPNNFGRNAFLIHGDNQANNHTASQGCIILPKSFRELLKIGEEVSVTNTLIEEC